MNRPTLLDCLQRRGKPRVRLGPSGIHVFDRYSGYNVLLDEIRPPPETWARAPRQVSVALTNACDLACAHCYAPKHHAVLDFDSLTGWLAELDANGAIGIGFGGGEPTLYPRFAELCRHAAEKTGLAVTFTTHGHHLDDSLIAALSGQVHFVRVSMDGVGPTYERIRGRSFGALRDRLVQLRALAPFGLNYVVNAQTMPELDAAVAFALQVGAAELLLLPEEPTFARPGIDAATAEGFRQWVRRYRGALRLSVSQRAAEGLPTCDPFADEDGLHVYAHIDATGVLKLSSYHDSGVQIGSAGVIAALHTLSSRLKNSTP